ncbi:MAG: hypothetical protein IKU93_02675 [Alistipes sp.]|nr:hypothetical protein [Alistipes sp.]
MKKLLLLTLCLIAFIGIVSAQQTQKEAAPNRYGWNEIFCWGSTYTDDLYGDVQYIKIKGEYDEDYRANEVEYYEFNDKGDVVYMESFFENDRGKMRFNAIRQFEYNDSGKIVKVKSKDRRFSKFWGRDLGTFEYNDKNELICEYVDWESGEDEYKYRYLYDNNGNKILQSKFDNKNNLTESTIYTYDSNNNLVSECNFDGNHNLVSRYDYIYEYDDRGNIIKELTQAYTNLEHKVTYDKKGNQILTPTCKVENKTITEYTIYSYDENNNLSESKRYVNDIIRDHLIYYTDGSKTPKEQNHYDKSGKLVSTLKYNTRGDVVESKYTYNMSIKYEYEYEYDSHNNIVKYTSYFYSNNAESPEVSYVEYEITYR